ncbi:hypothetical protein [Alkalihalobacillus sp. 1P02AB]|uniref:hypothetical protein n=1 Tax=Alkalihalobacillus sp. 1P02AB TaxID=3132260 RepID=UPI0039A6728D
MKKQLGTNEIICDYCKDDVRKDNVKFSIELPHDIIPREAVEALVANRIAIAKGDFCSNDCYNSVLVDETISYFLTAVSLPELSFLDKNFESDLKKAKVTLEKLRNYKVSREHP